MTSSLQNQFSIDVRRKLSRISMDTCTLTVKVIISISSGYLINMQPHVRNDLGNLFVLFS